MTRIQRPLKRPRRSILLDVFSGFQSLAYLAATLSLTYISVDISAVLVAGTSTFSANLVQDLSLLPHGQIIQCILEVLGISVGCIAFVWCSPPCRTFSFSDAVNATITEKRLKPCNYREHGPAYPDRPPRISLFKEREREIHLLREHCMNIRMKTGEAEGEAEGKVCLSSCYSGCG